ncbi:hypothetical protein HAX54_001435 [Datura stramonium]|uniref:Uncharacterized protein n=1 Tax=Datura stramonium TaxID=4076 RepID=A0ABS8WVK2_DATST|nr:hypothetical protein [Datura stramonium]
MDYVHINVGEIIVDQFKRKAKQQATTFPFPNLVSTAPLHIVEPLSSPPPDLFNIAQRAKLHENQLVRLAKDLPSMIHGGIKKALQPAKDKLASLCSTVDVLECKVGTLKQEVVALTSLSSIAEPTPCEPEVVPEAPRSPSDDWLVGSNSESEQVFDEEPHHSRPPPPLMRSVYDVDPSWTPGGVEMTLYHELHTLPDN